MDFNSIKARYNAAFDAHNELLKRNAQRILSGEKPTAVEIEREKKALSTLEAARRALFDAFAP